MPTGLAWYDGGMTASPSPRVTTVVMTRDRREQLLRSLPCHGAPLVVVDNGSTDGSPDAAQACRPDARIVRAPGNLGALARNTGVELAQTPYAAFADDDSWWSPGSLDRAADLMDAHPGLAVLVASVLVGPQDRPDPINAQLVDSPLRNRLGLPGRPVLGFLACSVVVRRSAFLGVGGFDEVVFFYGEETRVALDLVTRGWGVQHVPELVVHHHPRTRRPGDEGRPLLADRNELLTALMRRPWPVVVRHAARLGASPPRWPALAAAACRAPGALRRRRPIPSGLEAELRLLGECG